MLRRCLDPRPADEADRCPIEHAVNIPFDELEARTYELPPRDVEIGVVGPADRVGETVSWLRTRGRRACEKADFSWCSAAKPLESGRLWQPNGFLERIAPALAPGAALDLGCGAGREAVYLASLGWRVVGVDVLPDALERARRLAARHAAAIVPIDWRCVDLERSAAAFGRQFDLVVGFRYLHRPLLRRMAEFVVPRGSVVWETFTTAHRGRHGRPARDAHVLAPGELRALFEGWAVEAYEEGWRGQVHTARIWARCTT